jgi:cysteine desulfurase/selenocysteine lyase
MPLHERLGVPATARASYTIYNDASEVERLAEGVLKVKATFRR